MFIGRRPDGSIYGAWTSLQPNDEDHTRMEEVADDHPDLLVFLTPKPPAGRIQDPLEVLLIKKGIITKEEVDLEDVVQKTK